MSLTKQDIERLAELARIEISEEEKISLLHDMNAIVGYISEIESVSVDAQASLDTHINITRPDEVTTLPGMYSDAILDNAPKRNKQYIEVQQVLS
jgi:aspartyl-tRNA(Asn)/glutamyl-tRNA(Gln) amidotransferase subunit C